MPKSLYGLDMEFPAKLTKLVEGCGLSHRALGRAVNGQSASTVGRWMAGQSKISLQDAAKLARVLGVSLDYLGNDEQDRPDPPIISEDEAVLLRVFRASGLSVDEAIALFTGRAAAVGPARVVRVVPMEGPFGPIVPHTPPEPSATVTGKANGPKPVR